MFIWCFLGKWIQSFPSKSIFIVTVPEAKDPHIARLFWCGMAATAAALWRCFFEETKSSSCFFWGGFLGLLGGCGRKMLSEHTDIGCQSYYSNKTLEQPAKISHAMPTLNLSFAGFFVFKSLASTNSYFHTLS